MRLASALLMLAACDPQTTQVEEPPRPPDPMNAPAYCADPYGRRTPKEGLLAGSCHKSCLPPEQAYSVCTERGNRYFSTRAGLQINYRFVATYETKTKSCPDLPWRVWEVTAAQPADETEGKTTDILLQSDCSASLLRYTDTFGRTTTRVWYSVVREVVPTVVE